VTTTTTTTTTQAIGSVDRRIAEELGVKEGQVTATVALLDDGATVPFVARYRKEATGGLDDAQHRPVEERLGDLRALEKPRAAHRPRSSEQGKLTDELAGKIRAADTRARLEDIYLPYKPKRRTKAQIAREAGLEPLAELLMTEPGTDREVAAAGYLDDEKGVADVAAALQGARAILTERFTEDADLVGELRERMWSHGRLVSRVKDGEEQRGAKFADYFDFAEPFTDLPSHRVLALLRAEKEKVIQLTFEPTDGSEEVGAGRLNPYEQAVAQRFDIADRGRPADAWLVETVRWAWKTRLLVRLEVDMHSRLREAAEDDAVNVFAGNLRDLLLAAPAGTRATIGLDPGLRTGVKVAVVDGTGKVVATDTVYPHAPQRRWDEALAVLGALVEKHGVELVAVGNGTASRETDKLAGDLVKLASGAGRKLVKTMVSEAGASVYSASAYASRELPDLDVSLRGAVSIARRLQDPLAELVKIEPKSIGVGQYQHDVSEFKLSRSLDAVVEDCVNAVGVDVNTASAPLLSRVAGVSSAVADNIVAHRDSNGPFRSRSELTKVSRLGPATYEQCAGFMRIRGGDDPLDVSGVHPESYPVVRRMADAEAGGDVATLIGNTEVLRTLKPADFTDATFGLPTVTDILAELEKRGRGPRPPAGPGRGALGRHRPADGAGQPEAFAGVVEGLTREHEGQDLERLPQPGRALDWRTPTDAEGLELRLDRSPPDAQLEAASAQYVDGRRHLREQGRVPERVTRDHVADPDTARSHGQRRPQGPALEGVVLRRRPRGAGGDQPHQAL
jgi:protein Tex